MPEPVRILHIAETIKGGIATYLNQVVPELDLRSLSRAPLEQRLLVPEADMAYLPAIRAEQRLSFKRDGRGPLALLRFALATRRAIQQFQPDIVFVHSTFAGVLARVQMPIGRLAPKTVYCAHGWAFEAIHRPMVKRWIVAIELWLAKRTDRIIMLSDGELEDCKKLGFAQEKIVRVYNGIPENVAPSDRAAWEDERLKVLFVGRFDRQKGIDTLFAAAALAPDELSVRCAGDAVVSGGKLRDMPANVQILGWLSPAQLQAQFLAADIIAMPSRWEGLGIAAIEAMRAAKPIVASNIGGLREVVDNGITGWLVPADNPAALLAALLKPDIEARRAAGRAGRERFKSHFTLKQCVNGIHRVLEDVAP